MRHIIVGTAGHIDHGKSALVKALTGTDPDRLKEEKLRGITIDLGFAHLDLGDIQVGIVDVPGHERFIKNMLAGVGGIDIVLLVVAADESIMPQTREHFDICRLLGVQAGIIVISKADTVDAELIGLVQDEIRETVHGSFLENAETIPVSSKTGAGLEGLKEALRNLALKVPQRSANRLLRLPVDRAFTVRGFGTVVTGTLISGQVEKDQELELIPGGIITRVRGIQVHGSQSDLAVAGQRTAVNLPGMDLSRVQRGMVITIPRLFRATQLLDVKLELLPTAHPLKNLVKVRFHHGTSEVLARVALLGQEKLLPGESGYSQLRLDTPVFGLHGDPFIIRQFSPSITIGGGKVLNPHPPKHKATDRRALEELHGLANYPLRERIPVFLAANQARAMDLQSLNALLGMPAGELRTLCTELAKSGKIVMVPAPSPLLVLPPVLQELEASTTTMVTRFHKENPLQKGISREEVRKKLFDDLPLEVFRFCMDSLFEKRRISLHEENVSAYGREVQLSAESLRLKDSIEKLFQLAAYQPPGLSDLPALIRADPDEIRKISYWMIKEKILVKVSDDLAYHKLTLDEMKKQIRVTFGPGIPFGVAEFKMLFDITRKHAIPLLEFLDRDRFTKREGNNRILL
jgi:selenocysteine-specific elongation factor